MNILRKMGVSLCAGVLCAALLGLAWSNVGLTTIRDRNAVKGWLDKSDFYNQVVDVILEKAKDSTNSAETDISVTDPQVQEVAKKAFSPDFLKKNLETILDSGYAWADGTNDKLAFSIDLTDAKQRLAAGLGDYAKNKVAALPVCAPNQVTEEFDSFDATCRPAGITPEQAGQKVTSDLLTNKEFLAKPVFTSEDLKPRGESGDTQNVPLEDTEQAQAVKKAYRLSGYVPAALAVAALIAALGIILLSSDRYRGLRRAGFVILISGILLLVTYLIFGALNGAIDRKLDQEVANSAQNKLIGDITRVVVSDVKKALLPYIIGFTGVGIILAVAGGTIAKRRDAEGRHAFEGHKDMLPEPIQEPDKENDSDKKSEEVKKPESKKEK